MAPVRLRVVGKRGAVVRSGAALDSAKVVTLARGSFVFAAGGYDAGASRVCVVAEGRSRGWVSAKVLEIAPLSFIEARRSALQVVARFLDGPSLCRARLWGREARACGERWAKVACVWQRRPVPDGWRRSTVDWLKFRSASATAEASLDARGTGASFLSTSRRGAEASLP